MPCKSADRHCQIQKRDEESLGNQTEERLRKHTGTHHRKNKHTVPSFAWPSGSFCRLTTYNILTLSERKKHLTREASEGKIPPFMGQGC